MLCEIDPQANIPIYRQVMNQIRGQVMTGQLAEGDQLESVKNLSARLKVNPMTISKAYGYLVEEEIIERRRGIGLFVARIKPDRRKRLKNRMLADTLTKAATLAVQMDIPEAEAQALFTQYFRKIKSPERGDK